MSHNHSHEFSAGNKLKYSVFIAIAILVAEIVGGLLSNSLALLSDAGHVLADIIALGLSWYGVRQAERASDSRMTFGYHRIGVLVAIINAATIFVIASVIMYEAYRRFQQPPEVQSGLMMGVAFVGLAANIFITLWLRGEQKENINVRSAFWHSMGDMLASIGVIIAAIIILFTGQFWVDPLVSILIGLIILYAAFSILREGVRVILEASPRDVNVLNMIEVLKKVPGVLDVHDIHVWSITPELRAMNGHILIEDIATSAGESIRREAEMILREQFNITHTTLQMESQKCQSSDAFCTLEELHPERDPSLKKQDIKAQAKT